MALLSIYHISQCCFLFDFGSCKILTDPHIIEKCSQTSKKKKNSKNSLAADGVFVSHVHNDLQIDSICSQIKPETPLVVCEQNKKQFSVNQNFPVTGILPGQQATIRTVTIEATPAEHALPSMTCVMHTEHFSVFFGGHTRFVPELAHIAKAFPNLDVAVLPIASDKGQSNSHKNNIMNAQEAAGLCAVLQPRIVVPVFTGQLSSKKSNKAISANFSSETPGHFAMALSILAPDTKSESLQHKRVLKLKSL